MRRIAGITAVMLAVLIFLAGCGKKDAGDVVQDLNQTLNKMKSYQTLGKMILMTGEQPQEYSLEVWHMEPHYYRISLTNQKQDITQIVLKNDEGVFVLTPHLNKSFRFQSNWPTEQGQIYLYETLIQSIIKDEERLFTIDDEKDAYVFDVKADYQNQSLVRQKIWLARDNYAPRYVEISDDQTNVLIVLEFDEFELNRTFAAEDFDMNRNMTSWNMYSLPAMIDQMGANTATSSTLDHFGVVEPAYLPGGVQLQNLEEITWGDGNAILLRYGGAYHFTILQSRPMEQSVTAEWGEVIDLDLGYTVGVLFGEEQKTLRWVADGIEFRLMSADLPKKEMIEIAKSVYNQVGK